MTDRLKYLKTMEKILINQDIRRSFEGRQKEMARIEEKVKAKEKEKIGRKEEIGVRSQK